ncbi:LAGLIDADG family homing endonuclease [Patescibacteria group bacterium AH-259-L07]|nr:LAGLIDADG family homing endonuclease [Patescibacteria group bacterium AH-259-L07]
MGRIPTKNINQDFFKHWSYNMSYVLGYIVADGCIYSCTPKDRKKPRYFFCITSKDLPHLTKIKNTLSAQHKIYSKRSGYTGKNDAYQLQIDNENVYSDLIGLGICPRKTARIGSIDVPHKFLPDFVRGFFDGDGSVYIYTVNGTSQIKASFISASLLFITGLNNRLCENLNIPTKTIHQSNDKRNGRHMPLFYIDFYINDCEKLYQFMYGNNPELYLERKYQIFKKWESVKRRHYKKVNYPSKVGWHLNQKIYSKV